jgi:hypothetical protein
VLNFNGQTPAQSTALLLVGDGACLRPEELPLAVQNDIYATMSYATPRSPLPAPRSGPAPHIALGPQSSNQDDHRCVLPANPCRPGFSTVAN